MRRQLFVLSAIICLTASAEEFRDGDRVVFVGDSITHMGQYAQVVADYYLTRYSDREICFFKVGKGGNGIGHCLGWYASDVASMRPTVVSVMFGMNDINRVLYSDSPTDEELRRQVDARAGFATNLRKLDELIDVTSERPRRYYLTPPPYFDMADKATNIEQHVGANAALGACAAQVRAACAAHGGTLVDINATFNAYMRRWSGPDDRFITGWDRVHPQEGGHLLMAMTFLLAQNVRAIVSDVRLQAGRVICADNAMVSDVVSRQDGGVSFTLLEKALPMPVLKQGTEKMMGDLLIADAVNQEVVSFSSLASGEWTLAIDGMDVVTADAKAWLAGINLAFNEKTPQFAQAQRVGEENREHFKLVHRACAKWGRAGGLERQAEEGFARLRKLARPIPHRYELRRH